MDEIVFLHKIIAGGTDKSYGIHVAKLAGVPKTIIERSREILQDLENTFAKEASGEQLGRYKKTDADEASLFVQKNKSVLDKLASIDVNNLTPLDAINLAQSDKTRDPLTCVPVCSLGIGSQSAVFYRRQTALF